MKIDLGNFIGWSIVLIGEAVRGNKMCLIIENKTEKKLLSLLTKEKIAYYMQINPDGFGITTCHKKFITKRGFGLDAFLKALE